MALRGTNQEFGRPYNRRIVLESIRLHGPTTRGDIAERVGLTVQTVSTIVRELEEQGYLLSLREEPRGRGLPPATLRINPEGGYAVGIHLTPLGINAALINLARRRDREHAARCPERDARSCLRADRRDGAGTDRAAARTAACSASAWRCPARSGSSP